GSIDRAGAVNRYAFVVTEPTAVVFDSLTNNNQMRWQISGPTQTGAARAFTASDSLHFGGNPVMVLQPGSYEIAASANGATTGSYGFRLLDLAATNDLTLGEPQTVTLSPGNVTQLFAFDATAGDRLY